jgi:hypothetical protein
VDGTSGIIYEGAVGAAASPLDPHLEEFLTYVQWPVGAGHPLAELAHLAPAALGRPCLDVQVRERRTPFPFHVVTI